MRAQREDIMPTLGRWANILTVVAAGFLPAVYALLALALSVGGPSTARDAWILLLGKYALYAGVALALMAFLLAGASRIRREPVDSLWLAFVLLPSAAAIALLVYVFWVR